LIILFTRFR